MMKHTKWLALLLFIKFISIPQICSIQRETGMRFAQVTPNKQIQGNPIVNGILRVDGKPFRAVCNCNSEAMSAEQTGLVTAASFCNPSKIRLEEDHKGTSGVNLNEIRQSYGQPANAVFTKTSTHHLSCMDDRISEMTLSVPGGDLGIFHLALGVAYSFSHAKYDEDTVTTMLDNYLQTVQHSFHYCTDRNAVSLLEDSINSEGLDLNNPPPLIKPAIKSALNEYANVGDIHFQSMMKHPTWYKNFDPELTKIVQAAFYNILWNPEYKSREKIVLEVFAGKRNPAAFLEINTSQVCKEADIVPLLRSKTHQISVLIYHRSADESRRKEIAEFFMKKVGLDVKIEEFLSRMDRYRNSMIEATTIYAGVRNLQLYKLDYS